MMELTEVEKLALRDEKMGLKKSHVSWGPEGMKMSEEEQAKILNKIHDDMEEQFSKTVEIPIVQLEDIYESLYKLSKLGQATVQEWATMHDSERALRVQIRNALDMSLSLAGNWLPKENKKDIKHKLKD
jgi:hypothetical protein